eukprot:scaffold208219_cov28-Tisochrysis_lutea.AAC.1
MPSRELQRNLHAGQSPVLDHPTDHRILAREYHSEPQSSARYAVSDGGNPPSMDKKDHNSHM